MDSREFDDLIKDSLSDFSQLPKKEVRRAVFGFLIFQNLWVFHKVKLVGVFLFVAGVSLSTIYLYNDDNQVISFDEKPEISIEPFNGSSTNEVVANNQIFDLDESNGLVVNENSINSRTKNLEEINGIEFANKEAELDETALLLVKSRNNHLSTTNKEQTFVSIDGDYDKNDKVNLIPKENNKDAIASVSKSESKLLVNNQLAGSDNSSQYFSDQLNQFSSLVKHEDNDDLLDDKIDIKGIKFINTEASSDSVFSVPVFTPTSSSNDYANNKFKRGWTVDVYFSPFNRIDVDNVLDADYEQYWWDFYKEYDMKKSGISSGLNFSYNYRNFKINSGFNFSQVYDYKPTYDFYTKTDSIYVYSTNNELSLLSVDYISGLQVYGQDTAIIFYVDPNDSRLIDEISNQDANRYTYFKIPLTLGYEVSFKHFSFEVNAGVEYSRLVKSSGISFKQGYVDVGVRPQPYYFYKDMVATTYSNNSDVLKINNWNYVANFISRIRLSPSFDVYTSFNYQYHNQNIMSDSYLLEKTYKRFGVNFGATYYLNSRLSLKEQLAPKFQ